MKKGFPITFRAGGTCLSGQAVTDGILVDIARHWRKIAVQDGGSFIRLGPGVVGSDANLALKPYSRRIGPDPVSIDAAQLGGMVANNSSGMCCGVAQNAYHTLESLTFVLPSGTVIDTAAPDADGIFGAREPALAAGLLELKREIEGNAALRARIRANYRPSWAARCGSCSADPQDRLRSAQHGSARPSVCRLLPVWINGV